VGWFALYSQTLTVYCFGLFALRVLVCSVFQKSDCLLFLFVCAVRQEYTPDDPYTSYYRPLLPSCSYCSDEVMGSDSPQEAGQEVRTAEQQKLQTAPENELLVRKEEDREKEAIAEEAPKQKNEVEEQEKVNHVDSASDTDETIDLQREADAESTKRGNTQKASPEEGNHTLRRAAIAMSHSPQVHPHPHL
jgi:hypothetical protein